MADNYFTLKTPGEGLVREKMSRFLSFALPVSSVEEAVVKIKEYQNRFHDARHVCWAYMLGADKSVWQMNDNGEPSGTAGKPILGQIKSKDLTNVLVVVVRYFGGIKLGTSGLIVAYREAAKAALDSAEIIECFEMIQIQIKFPYQIMNDVMKIIKKENLETLEKNYDNICSFILNVRKDYSEKIVEMLGKSGVNIE